MYNSYLTLREWLFRIFGLLSAALVMVYCFFLLPKTILPHPIIIEEPYVEISADHTDTTHTHADHSHHSDQYTDSKKTHHKTPLPGLDSFIQPQAIRATARFISYENLQSIRTVIENEENGARVWQISSLFFIFCVALCIIMTQFVSKIPGYLKVAMILFSFVHNFSQGKIRPWLVVFIAIGLLIALAVFLELERRKKGEVLSFIVAERYKEVAYIAIFLVSVGIVTFGKPGVVHTLAHYVVTAKTLILISTITSSHFLEFDTNEKLFVSVAFFKGLLLWYHNCSVGLIFTITAILIVFCIDVLKKGRLNFKFAAPDEIFSLNATIFLRDHYANVGVIEEKDFFKVGNVKIEKSSIQNGYGFSLKGLKSFEAGLEYMKTASGKRVNVFLQGVESVDTASALYMVSGVVLFGFAALWGTLILEQQQEIIGNLLAPITSQQSLVAIAVFAISITYFALPLMLFPYAIDPEENEKNGAAAFFYVIYGSFLGHICQYLLHKNLDYPAWLFSIYGMVAPVILILLDCYKNVIELSLPKKEFYLNNLIILAIFSIQALYADQTFFSFGLVVGGAVFFGGRILLTPEILDIAKIINFATPEWLKIATLYGFVGAALALNLIEWCKLGWFCAGIAAQIIIVDFFITGIKFDTMIILYEAIKAFNDFINAGSWYGEEIRCFKKLYSESSLHHFTVGDLLRWKKTETNSLNQLIQPILSTSSGRMVMEDLLKNFLNQYKEKIAYKDQDRAESKENFFDNLGFEQIMNLEIVRIHPYLLLQMPLNFYGNNFFRQVAINGAIMSYILDYTDKGIKIFLIEELSDEDITSKRKNSAEGRYSTGYSAPVIDWYALYDEQIRGELARDKVISIFPHDILQEIRPASRVFESRNKILCPDAQVDGLVLYRKQSDNVQNFIAIDDGSGLVGSRSILEEYLGVIDRLAGKAIDTQNAFQTLFDTGTMSLDSKALLHRQRRVDIIHLFGLLTLDANFEVEYIVQTAKRDFLKEIGAALCQSINNPYYIPPSEMNYENAGENRAGFLFYKSVFELIYKYANLPGQQVKVRNVFTGEEVEMCCSDMGAIYGDGNWKNLQLEKIRHFFAPQNREFFSNKLNVAYKFGRMFAYLLKINALSERFKVNYGRYYILHANHKNERSISVSIDALMQDCSFMQLGLPIIISDNLESVDSQSIQKIINEYMDLYLAKLVMDTVWYETYKQDESNNFASIFSATFGKGNEPYKDFESAITRSVGEKFFNRAQVSEGGNFAYRLGQKTLEILKEQFLAVMPMDRIFALSNKICELAEMYQHDYITNLKRFECLAEMGNSDSVTYAQHSFLNKDLLSSGTPKFNPALMGGIDISVKNFRYFVSQEFILYNSKQNGEWGERIYDVACFNLKHDEKIPSKQLLNKINQNFTSSSLVPMMLSYSWAENRNGGDGFASIHSDVDLRPPVKLTENYVPGYNQLPNPTTGNAAVKNTDRSIFYSPAVYNKETLVTYCSHYVLENPSLSISTQFSLKNNCLLNKDAEIGYLGAGDSIVNISSGNLATASTLSKITPLIGTEVSKYSLWAGKTKIWDFSPNYKWNSSGWVRIEFENHVPNMSAPEVNNNIYQKPSEKRFTASILESVTNFCRENELRYEQLNIPEFSKGEGRVDLKDSRLPQSGMLHSTWLEQNNVQSTMWHPHFITGQPINPFRPYKNSPPVTVNATTTTEPNYHRYYDWSGDRKWLINNFQWIYANPPGAYTTMMGENRQRDPGYAKSLWWRHIDKFYRDQRVQFFKYDARCYSNPWDRVGDVTLVMLTSFYACQAMENGRKKMNVTFAKELAPRYKYRLGNAVFKFSRQWAKPVNANNKLNYTEEDLLYLLSRKGGMSLNYIYTLLKDLGRFGKDLEFSFRREPESWMNNDKFWMCFYKSTGNMNRGHNFDYSERRGEFQTAYAYNALRYQNYIENLRPVNKNDRDIVDRNIGWNIPDCGSVYLYPQNVVNFLNIHRACSLHFRNMSQNTITKFKENPLTFFDSSKTKLIVTYLEKLPHDELKVVRMDNRVFDFNNFVEILRIDMPA